MMWKLISLFLLNFYYFNDAVEYATHFPANLATNVTAQDERLRLLDSNHTIERILTKKELERSKEIFSIAKSEGYVIKGFYHTSIYKKEWEKVFAQQLNVVDGRRKVPKDKHTKDVKNVEYIWDTKRGVSLLKVSTELYLNVAGKHITDLAKVKEFVKTIDLKYANKIVYNFNYTVDRSTWQNSKPEKRKELEANPFLSEGEYSTIKTLHDYCTNVVKDGNKSLVYYFHSKSTGNYRDFKPVSDPVCNCCRNKWGLNGSSIPCPCCMPSASWRESMNAFHLEFPSICARAILRHGYSACGAENQIAHYSGNYWWADCQHIAALDPPNPRFNPWAYEFFVLGNSYKFNPRFGYRCGYNVFHCGVNRYDYECPRETYRDLLIRYVSNQIDLPPSHKHPHGNDKNHQTDICQKLKGKLYQSNPEFKKNFG